ncbi:MAG: hypothetical protein ACXAC5_01775 [Promethearchaeota archaeon]|jgi:hypothetical protein
MIEWIIGYLIIGIAISLILWKKFNIEWKEEAKDIQALMIATPFLWPFVLLLIGGLWLFR